MLAFGLGTLPWLLAAGAAAAQLRRWMSFPAVRLVVGGGVMAFGLHGLL
jgi:sulfite exporter TauE/SafE